jgi:hypothetical protein
MIEKPQPDSRSTYEHHSRQMGAGPTLRSFFILSVASLWFSAAALSAAQQTSVAQSVHEKRKIGFPASSAQRNVGGLPDCRWAAQQVYVPMAVSIGWIADFNF